jgi:dienelactone hydrolase
MRGPLPLATTLLLAFLACSHSATAQTSDPPTLENWRIIERVGRYGRSAIHTDAIEHEIVLGTWTIPQTGDAVPLPDGKERTWQATEPDSEGWIKSPALRGGYTLATVNCPTPRVAWLEASGHSRVYVNGQLRTGDPYRTGWARLPIMLQAGENWLLFHCGRGQLRATLEPADTEKLVQFNTRDLTVPDLLTRDADNAWGAIPVLNARIRAAGGLTITASCDGADPVETALPAIPPLSLRKVPFQLPTPASPTPGELDVSLQLLDPGRGDAPLDKLTVKVRIRRPNARHKRTFISDIDGSVQYYAVTPAHPTEATPATALILTLHGAAVEATNQARAYQHKPWAHVVAPTNRRPYGFDWEDWGRWDALEVLDLATRQFQPDRRHIYLTGHSMGGHGVWNLAALVPDPFAAIAPSAGWISFWSYAGADRYEGDSSIVQILRRATLPSDTLMMSRNYLQHGIYILHGEKDDNVPVDQARQMRTHLAEFHPDFAYYERPGAGHWWGNACVDWPPLMDFLRHHRRPDDADVRHVEFITPNPADSATAHWVTIAAQQRSLLTSSVDLRLDPDGRRFHGTTENVARLELDLSALSELRQRERKGETIDATGLPANQPLTLELDDQTLADVAWPPDTRLHLRNSEGRWSVTPPASPAMKGPHRHGPFKHAFRNRFVLVFATQGTTEENAWAFAKARYDAETFWYRGNGAVDVIPDTEFDATHAPHRNVILYGNMHTNAAWDAVLHQCPVEIAAHGVIVGPHHIVGEDLACLFVYPRAGSDRALVGVVGGCSPVGMRLTDRLPYFVSGVAYPDCIVLAPDVLTQGTDGIRAAGFFGNDWQVDSGDFTIQE